VSRTTRAAGSSFMSSKRAGQSATACRRLSCYNLRSVPPKTAVVISYFAGRQSTCYVACMHYS